ncbi:PREDICTED: putative RNA polymerase II subunit B1 CTD phosphatase RPAP2 homolog [Nelumbo nucifera]|uniref:RNA polymerase II subunit B1 CTD phosphatase RPAP2 homolog n=2 Tax=Nelumbo nucifera TaxID=4432 RepID=A0A1U8B6R7_NELNU|nr:PREDICTED: putative RNA polymerase II subunit B1 CTD phosphatase RPAP2 homolog [Nelumbo nucifera]XP_010271591.1 PREDICTED: putative RNA polymerase II subunit B1 CTD phosphatase RPAP2 homolog [Nelumbo nucifera]XP_019055034.1 PREDICTED: putative RNA polymerase II subunit B1 CTD phosphatase RPAP2 homolog [Nelumbo nucifera]DAD28889.1 TPA_asm: hypothetical protein HUJ06_030357 [Nelumbo nucifera]
MVEHQPLSVKDAVHKLQLSLLEGICNEDQLFAAGSLMSRSDYEDVVTERHITKVCGYPLCKNPLSLERPRKGRYRISVKEHKVYDLQETYMYCSSGCLVNSRAFAGSLATERCSVSDSSKINEVLRLFEDLSSKDKEILGEEGNLGFSKLKIQEKEDVNVTGNVSLEDWIGPSNAIEGYVPKNCGSKHLEEGSKQKIAKSKKGKDKVAKEMDFKSTIIIGDQFKIPKAPAASNGYEQNLGKSKSGESSCVPEEWLSILNPSPAPEKSGSGITVKESEGEISGNVLKDHGIPGKTLSGQNVSDTSGQETKIKLDVGKTIQSGETALKSSIKPPGAKKLTRNVTWADERESGKVGNDNLVKIAETQETAVRSDGSNVEDEDCTLCFASAEACAIALSQAAEAVASGESDVFDAVSDAGIVIMPHPPDADEGDTQGEVDVLESERIPFRWPRRRVDLDPQFFYFEDILSEPPDGFSMSLSPFGTIWMALFGWITSSTLAYIYGRDENSHLEFQLVNGKEYPCKVVFRDGRSYEIKETLASCLSRALPGLVADVNLPTPISTLEQGMGCLLDTMTFVEALPSLRMKQWHVIVFLFVDALSVCRMPALNPLVTSRRMLLQKVLDGAQISGEEYELMKDHILPLGRLPQFSTQSGG